ncbi:uncharacterized protein LOC134789630 [Cydia splendana]|uniref:uncharacterized protein LOC134789630 n=1 Tax=Cydia splendana TaxID=1100963 RepID=UPI00300C5B06
MSSVPDDMSGGDNLGDINVTLMTLRKPTELKKIIDSVPKPLRSVPKNGLPLWYRLGLECKLPVPKMPAGKITFSRGRIGEDVRRVGLGNSNFKQTFDLTDPYCNNVSYDYVPMHDPHLAYYFAQKAARNRMKQLGFCTVDNRAVCSLKDFNQYRKYLYNEFMDQIHQVMKVIDERARDDLTMKRVEKDVARRQEIFTKSERARQHLEKVATANAAEWAEKKRLAKEQELKIQMRMNYLQEYNERMRQERAKRVHEKENRIKQRVEAAAELELKRKITMVRQWRTNEKNRLRRQRQEREARIKFVESEANRKWNARVQSQNAKIQEEALLLKIYTEDMNAGTQRRLKKSEKHAYNTDLQLQCIRLNNLKESHGKSAKADKLVRKMGTEFEKSKRGTKGMSPEYAQEAAIEAMATAMSTSGDNLMNLGQARIRMDMGVVLPSAPVKVLEEILKTVVMEFARRHTHAVMRDVERTVREHAAISFFRDYRPPPKKRGSKEPRWRALTEELAKHQKSQSEASIQFGKVTVIPPDGTTEQDLKSARHRTPTPMPSMTKLAELTFTDKLEDLTEPVAIPQYLPERLKLLENVNAAAKLLTRSVGQIVDKRMDLVTGKVTLLFMRHPMEWGEAVESLTCAVVNNGIYLSNPDVRHCSEFLAQRVLSSLQKEMKEEKKRLVSYLFLYNGIYLSNPDVRHCSEFLAQRVLSSLQKEMKEKKKRLVSYLFLYNGIYLSNPDVRHCSEFLAQRVLSSLQKEMKEEKKRLKAALEGGDIETQDQKDFYVPDQVKEQEPN